MNTGAPSLSGNSGTNSASAAGPPVETPISTIGGPHRAGARTPDRRAEEGLAFAHRRDSVDQIVFRGVFQQIPLRPGLQRFQDITLVGVHAQEYDGRLRSE